MRALVIGTGGREHALTEGLVRSASVAEVLCAPGNPGMPKVICPPSNAGPAGHDAARTLCLLPTINSVLVPMSMTATSRSSLARSTASMQAAASAPTCPLMIGRP